MFRHQTYRNIINNTSCTSLIDFEVDKVLNEKIEMINHQNLLSTICCIYQWRIYLFGWYELFIYSRRQLKTSLIDHNYYPIINSIDKSNMR